MAKNILRSAYSVQVTRKGGECVASIPELCIAEKAATPQEALLAALQAEAKALQSLQDRGMPLPPSADRLDPFPGVTRSASRYFPFVAKIAIGYVLVVCMTVILVLLAYPSARLRAEQYLASNSVAADAGKVFAKLGIALCLQDR